MGVWKCIVNKSEEIEKVTKPIALILASMGLIALYVPELKRCWEELITTNAWYQVGAVRVDEHGNPHLVTGDYDSPAWNSGARYDLILALKGKDVLTTGTAVGRDKSETSAQVDAVLDKNQCLHVTDLAFGNYRPGSSQETAARLATFTASGGWETQWNDILASRKKKDVPNCQPLAADEWAKKSADQIKAAAGTDHPMTYDASRPVCARTAIWIQAQKVSC